MKSNYNSRRQTDLICLSHLRWNFVYQRPQHLMSRFARHKRVFYIEEPVFDAAEPFVEKSTCPHSGVHVVTPHLVSEAGRIKVMERLLLQCAESHDIRNPIAWFYTPMALEFFPESLAPAAIVYDCMDELSLFQGAPPHLSEWETRLMNSADLVFTGGISLFEAKRSSHPRVYPFPSGVDVAHFMKARNLGDTPPDNSSMRRPRLGYAGVVDERLDLELIDEAARQRPDWSFVMIGPVVKISPASLPRRRNLHWLGMKNYSDLPHYFAGWDVAMMPFALNKSTRFISPTKTPEYLAAGKPVVSTSIRDVVKPYGECGVAHIADTPEAFVAAVEKACGGKLRT